LDVQQGLLISELSRQVNVPVSTIRYYERQGLLNPSRRTQSQYRVYTQDAQDRLQFIQKAKKFGLSLEEIKEILDLSAKGMAPCENVRAMVKHHLEELDRHIQEMLHLRQELSRRYAELEAQLATLPSGLDRSPRGKVCGLIEQEA
jgi:MerR family transcriptional regulator, copper efflux regulator